MPEPHRVVQAVEPWRDDQTGQPTRKCQSNIGVLQALPDPSDHDKAQKLARHHTNKECNKCEDGITQQIIDEVITVVRPEGHPSLRVVDSMKRPPPVPSVLKAMNPVVDKI